MDRYDALFVAGLVMIALGAGLVYLPAGLIAGGLGLIIFGVIGARAIGNISGAGYENQER